MDIKALGTVAALALAGFAAASLAQVPESRAGVYDARGSKNCDGMIGGDRVRCLSDEGSKTEKGTAAPPGSSTGGSASASRCEAIANAADKEQCLRDEVAKADSGVRAPGAR